MRTALFGISCFMVAFFVSLRIFDRDGDGWKQIITSDGRGYYAYLPALLTDGDLTYEKVVRRESQLLKDPGYEPGYLVKVGDRRVNKYFAGEALLLLPFFLTGWFFSWLSGMPADGYGFPFQIFVGLGSLFYLIPGLWFLAKIFKELNVRRDLSALLLVFLLFGTNFFYYSLWQPTMSHLYSFFAVNGFVLSLLRGLRKWDLRQSLITGFFLAVLLLIRPTHLLLLLVVPFLAGTPGQFVDFMKTLKQEKRATLAGFLLLLMLTAIQPLLWYLQTGHFFIWPYRNEGFRFGQPEIINMLFSYRKGLFVYTPIILLTWICALGLWFTNRFRWLTMVIFLAATTYVTASWWNWYYGDGFGMRPLIDYYGLFFLLPALTLNRLPSRILSPLLLTIFLPLAALNLFQTWQYTHWMIHPNSMNREKYHYLFLNADPAENKRVGGNLELPGFTVDMKYPSLTMTSDNEKDAPGWIRMALAETTLARSGTYVSLLDSLHPFSTGLAIKTKEIGKIPGRFFVEGSVMLYDSVPGAGNETWVVLSADSVSPGKNYWQGFKVNDTPDAPIRKWRQCSFSLTLPVFRNPEAQLKIYVWNKGKKTVLVDDFTVKFYRDQAME